MMQTGSRFSMASVAGSPPVAGGDVEAYYREIAPFYDAEVAGRDDLDFWRVVGAEHRGGHVLELGAGSGRVTEVLALFAGEVVAVDVSPELLRLARDRLGAWPCVKLIRADMRALAFRRPFDLIVAANDPFSHLVAPTDRDRALEVVARHLAPDGRFVLDALWLSPAEASAVASTGGRVRRRTTVVDSERLGVVERWERPPDSERCCHAQYEYRLSGRPPVIAEVDVRDWSPDELDGRFRRAGLGVTRLWGSYRREAWHARRSGQLIVEAGRT
jgi:SAM-dependent methyltransferase